MKNWNKNFAINIARKKKIILNDKHWDIIYFIRDFYYKYKISPSINILIIFFNKKNINNKISLNYLNLIFKNKFDKNIYKISGIPYPNKCLL
ncbi:TusE/DsrC/DsvC family sulfur relay protein [endosymbiont of Pachyrhynchus infernalis]|uniref:TusE/DsrC/DsvC family sulfur relay protein n=1 Tax=endosymbiont of Pachyrhynchus infernalis TaxID=1971488 RepID=UPI000DC70EFB|nr:TusE/DsrC/DsvC family sulfur relay protein [endosymbiont of Pachyrhynchus infernalis]BBA84886.1 sulfurtransferase [endosymbiont of Pachyrhynchus infernalis]